MAYIVKAQSLSKLSPGDMYYAGGRWSQKIADAKTFRLKKEATAFAKEQNENSSIVHDVEVIKLEK